MSRVALAAIASWSLLSEKNPFMATFCSESSWMWRLRMWLSLCFPHKDCTCSSSFPSNTHRAIVVLAQFQKDSQVEFEEETKCERASEVHHPTRCRGWQVHFTCQQAAGILQQLLIPVSAREHRWHSLFSGLLTGRINSSDTAAPQPILWCLPALSVYRVRITFALILD